MLSDAYHQISDQPIRGVRDQQHVSLLSSQVVVDGKHTSHHGVQLLKDVGGRSGGQAAMPAHSSQEWTSWVSTLAHRVDVEGRQLTESVLTMNVCWLSQIARRYAVLRPEPC